MTQPQDQAPPPAMQALESPDPTQRASAARKLAAGGYLPAVPRLVNMLFERNDNVRQAVHEALNSLIVQGDVLQNILDTLLDEVMAITDAERGAILMYDKTTPAEVRFWSGYQLSAADLDAQAFQACYAVVQQSLGTGQPMATTNVQTDPRFAEFKSMMSQAVRTIVVVPLLAQDGQNAQAGDAVLGVVYIDSPVRRAVLRDEERDAVQTLVEITQTYIQAAYARLGA